jgi:hypothetical protein
MIDNQKEFNSIVYTVGEILKADKESDLYKIVKDGIVTIRQTGYDNWDGGIYLYTVFITLDTALFVQNRDRIQNIEATLLEKFSIATRHLENESISNIWIAPVVQSKIDWSLVGGLATKENLLKDVQYLKNVMISVSTGGQRIQDVNEEYKNKFNTVNKVLQKLNLENPNIYKDLWGWYGKWSADFKKYTERRAFIGEMYEGLIQSLEGTNESELINITVDLTNWERIERSINEIKLRQNEAQTEEQFQVVGLLSRETIITLAQGVFLKEKHPSIDGKEISGTDAKRMLEAYIAVEISGSTNEVLRRFARATIDLSNELAHRRTASKRDAALCATATISLINLIGAIEGRI